MCSANICVRLAELECGAGRCITLEKNLAVFDAARKSKDRPVDCELADTGTSCDGSFFRFEGDIYRWETRFFDKSGRAQAYDLVAARRGDDGRHVPLAEIDLGYAQWRTVTYVIASSDRWYRDLHGRPLERRHLFRAEEVATLERSYL